MRLRTLALPYPVGSPGAPPALEDATAAPVITVSPLAVVDTLTVLFAMPVCRMPPLAAAAKAAVAVADACCRICPEALSASPSVAVAEPCCRTLPVAVADMAEARISCGCPVPQGTGAVTAPSVGVPADVSDFALPL